MSETKHISEMAEKVADNLFAVFKWERKVVSDHSWDCNSPEEHGGKKDHPSDCIFYYRDPYDGEVKYINTDLKSYAKTTISKEQINKAIHSLSYATNCAAYNENWRKLFKPTGSFSVIGMLFVYNHCGGYNGNFSEIIAEIGSDDNHLDSDKMICIFSPYQITTLNSIASDIRVMIGKDELPKLNKFSYYHPNEMLIKNHFDHDYTEPATINVLSSPWIIIKHAECEREKAGYLIYYTKDGSEEEEFDYFIDALSYYQIINNTINVRIKLTKKNDHAANNLITAICKYYKFLGRSEEESRALANNMVKGTIDQVVPQFSPIELGVLS
ncbi:hypothetical protein [Yersinia frederiksenii]|uniref:hypothetical protein n=1 Tax=Yersinia frederiksenii TaxID=29484 RepID=UPI0005E9846F|nr:hypothetical protein [Yersinia frederiksenii]CQI96454.1 Uncharacterised protein [Yersinia frederiksenii]